MTKVTDMKLFLMHWVNARNILRRNSSSDEDDWIWMQKLRNALHVRDNDAFLHLKDYESSCEKEQMHD